MKVKIQYIKPSGKFYEQVKSNFTQLNYMFEVSDAIKHLRDEHRLPGLKSGSWDGYIYCTAKNGYPILILPPE